MGVVPFSTSPQHPSVVFEPGDFELDGSVDFATNIDIPEHEPRASVH